jgi:hypothetical protein
MLLRLLVCGALPAAVYFATGGHIHGQVPRLAVSGAIPVVWTAAVMVWRRRLDPIGALSVLGFGIRLLVAVLLHKGGALALKIGPLDIIEGVAGLILLGSALIRRPILAWLLGLLGRMSPRFAVLRQRVGRLHSMTLLTALVGALLLADSVLHVVLAVLLPTSTFVIVSQAKRYVLLGGGAVLVLIRLRYQRRHPPADAVPDTAPAEPRSAERTR